MSTEDEKTNEVAKITEELNKYRDDFARITTNLFSLYTKCRFTPNIPSQLVD